MKIYAAVIEGPEAFADAGPSLILEHSEQMRDAMICAEILETANALTEPDWRNILSSASVGNLALMESDTYVGPQRYLCPLIVLTVKALTVLAQVRFLRAHVTTLTGDCRVVRGN